MLDTHREETPSWDADPLPTGIDALEVRVKDLETALRATVDSIEWMTIRWMRAADIKEAKREVLDTVDLVRSLLS